MSRIIVLSGRGLAIVCFSLCSIAYVHAEDLGDRDTALRFGGFLGAGFTDSVGKDANGSLPGVEAVPKRGLSAGLLATINLSTLMDLGIAPFYLAVQPELAYAMKGWEIELDGEGIGTFVNMRYLQAGLLFRVDYDISASIAPYFLIGPEMGFLLQAVYERRAYDPINTKDTYKSTDFGLIAGLGTLFSFPPWGAASLELRADLGLVSIDGQGDGDEIRNAALLLLLGYLY